MTNIDMYVTKTCGFCFAAKRLLASKGVSINEIDVNEVPQKREEMVKRAQGARTVPQIFIDDIHIGGCTELYDLNAAGNLDKLLLINAPA